MTPQWLLSSFGEWLHIEMPPGCNVIIVGVQKHQIVPVCVLLPHQLYRKTVAAILEDHDSTEIHIIPYNSEHLQSYKIEDLCSTVAPHDLRSGDGS